MQMSEDNQQLWTGQNPQKESLKSIISTIGLFIAAPLVALFITGFVFQSYEVDGQSMETTLSHKDRLIVLKLPRSWSKLTKTPYIPPRSDIVVFNRTGGQNNTESTQEKHLIKRVIGLPGDRVVVDAGKLTIYNNEHPEGYNPDTNSEYGRSIGYTPGKVDITVPEKEVFVVGDNRSNSLDSRSFGTVPVHEIVGSLSLRILPINKARNF